MTLDITLFWSAELPSRQDGQMTREEGCSVISGASGDNEIGLVF